MRNTVDDAKKSEVCVGPVWHQSEVLVPQEMGNGPVPPSNKIYA